MAMLALQIATEAELEERIAIVETKVDHIQSDVSEIKGDLRRLDDKVERFRQEVTSGFRWLLGAYGGGVILILGFVYFLFSQI